MKISLRELNILDVFNRWNLIATPSEKEVKEYKKQRLISYLEYIGAEYVENEDGTIDVTIGDTKYKNVILEDENLGALESTCSGIDQTIEVKYDY